MAYKASNNGAATLAVGINTSETTIQVATGLGDRFPVISGGNHTYITFEKVGGDIEVMKVTARASGSDSMTVVRAQDGTTAKTWLVGDVVECRPCAAAIADLQAEAAAATAAAVSAHEAAADPHPNYALESAVTSSLAGKSDTGHTHTVADITDAGTAASKNTGTTAGSVPLWEHTLLNGVSAKSAGYTVVAGDRGKLIDCDGTFTLSLTAAATLGVGFAFGVRNSGSGTITIDPSGAETVDGATTVALAGGESCLVVCDGSAFKTVGKAGGSAVAGTVAAFAMNTAPTGWLKANGAAVSRTTYASLFAAIGTTFGAGDGSTTFNLPDLRGEFIRGWDDGRGVDSGRAFGSAQGHAFASHSHASYGRSASTSGFNGGATDGFVWGQENTSDVGGVETRPRNVALLACIKF